MNRASFLDSFTHPLFFETIVARTGTGVAPKPIDLFNDWEHSFLVQEFIRGTQLTTFSATNNVTLMTNPTLADTEKFFADFKTIFIQLAGIVKTLHENNVVFSDLSPNNVIILRDPLRVRIIDFEGASEVGIDKPAFLYTPGFAYRDQIYGGVSNFESDYFSLGAVMHYFLAPFNQIFAIAPRSRFTFLKEVVEDIGFPREVHETIVALIENDYGNRPKPERVIEVLERDYKLRPPAFSVNGEEANPKYQKYVEGICQYCLALSDYERRDRLFPAYAPVFHTNPLSLAFGACGVAHAIQAMGGEVPERVLDWILQPTGDRDLDRVSFGFNGQRILSDFGLAPGKGERILVVGPNGSGKSTLAHLMSGLLPPNSGITTTYPLKRVSAVILPYDFIPGTVRGQPGIRRTGAGGAPREAGPGTRRHLEPGERSLRTVRRPAQAAGGSHGPPESGRSLHHRRAAGGYRRRKQDRGDEGDSGFHEGKNFAGDHAWGFRVPWPLRPGSRSRPNGERDSGRGERAGLIRPLVATPLGLARKEAR